MGTSVRMSMARPGSAWAECGGVGDTVATHRAARAVGWSKLLLTLAVFYAVATETEEDVTALLRLHHNQVAAHVRVVGAMERI